MPYKVKIDRTLCIGAGSCMAVNPTAFELDEEGKAVILNKNGSRSSDWTKDSDIDTDDTSLLNAAKSCPVNAIIIMEIDEQGKEIKQVWPDAGA